jgi:hypothetical protein
MDRARGGPVTARTARFLSNDGKQNVTAEVAAAFLDQGLVVVQPTEMRLDTLSGSPAADPKLTEPEVQNMLAIKENWKLAVTLTASTEVLTKEMLRDQWNAVSRP